MVRERVYEHVSQLENSLMPSQCKHKGYQMTRIHQHQYTMLLLHACNAVNETANEQ